MDENGVKRVFAGRNREQRDVMHDTHHDLQALEANGINAVPLAQGDFDSWLDQHQFTFVNFVRVIIIVMCDCGYL